jgi:hypothetical protein
MVIAWNAGERALMNHGASTPDHGVGHLGAKGMGAEQRAVEYLTAMKAECSIPGEHV